MIRNLLLLKRREKEIEELNHHLTDSVLKCYIPPSLIEEILAGKVDINYLVRETEVIVLFSDLCGFTKLSAKMGAAGISNILNDYLNEMIEIIFWYSGIIDKFIGDAIMVIFGAPMDSSGQEQTQKAVECSLDMQKAMKVLNQKWQKENIPEFNMRIGLHHGQAVVGNFGNVKRSDYTAIGPTVNMASRIESACEPGRVYISGEVADYLEEDMFEKAGDFELKGIKGEVALYKIAQDGVG